MARLLIVDDDPDQLDIRQLVMEEAGHQVATAADAQSALAEYDRHAPEIVLMDLRLPRTEDGLELIRGLRQRSPTVPILVLTGWPENVSTWPEGAMVNHFLRKPVRSQELLRLIDEIA